MFPLAIFPFGGLFSKPAKLRVKGVSIRVVSCGAIVSIMVNLLILNGRRVDARHGTSIIHYLQGDASPACVAVPSPTANGVSGCRDGGRAPVLVDGEVKVEEDDPGEVTEEYPANDGRNFVAPDAAVVDVQREDGQGTGARNQADRDTVVETWGGWGGSQRIKMNEEFRGDGEIRESLRRHCH